MKIRYICVGLILTIVIIVQFSKWSARNAWEACKKETLARGEKWSLLEMAPPPVRGDQNFAMTPLMRPLFEPQGEAYGRQLTERLKLKPGKGVKGTIPKLPNWQFGRKGDDLAKWAQYLGQPDVFTALESFAPELAEIAQASRLPSSRFPLQYEKNIAMRVPMLSPVLNLGRLYHLRANAELASGQTEKALEDVQTLLRLSDTLKGHPTLILHLVRISFSSMATQIVWSGLEARQWSAAQLAVLQKTLEKGDALESGEKALRSEQACLHDVVEDIMSRRKSTGSFFKEAYQDTQLGPMLSVTKSIFGETFFYRNGVTAHRFYETYFWPAIDLKAGRVFPRKLMDGEAELSRRKGITHPDFILSNLMLPAISGVVSKMAFTQTALDEAALACALERYWLEKGMYPDTLSELVPQWIAKVPQDVIGGKPLRYRRTPDGRFMIYSIGWNETDDGGKTVAKSTNLNNADLKAGDWVWSYEPR